jgi:hypothetical protein
VAPNQSSRACIFCGEPSSRHGEHVLPKWLLKRFVPDEGSARFTREVRGQPIRKANSDPRTSDGVAPYLLPVCDQASGQDCNGKLNSSYEVLGKPAVRTVLAGAALETKEDVSAFARWWIKTILLLQHPATSSTVPGEVMHPWDMAASVYGDLLHGVLPSDVSVWAAVANDGRGSGCLPEALRIHLPTTSDPEGTGGKPETLLMGFQQTGATLLLVQLVVHPLCDFQHPFEASGSVARVWPSPPGRFDISGLPALDAEGRWQLGALFVDGGYGEHLPSRGCRVRVEAVPDATAR